MHPARDGSAARLAVGRTTVQRWERGVEAALVVFCRERALFTHLPIEVAQGQFDEPAGRT